MALNEERTTMIIEIRRRLLEAPRITPALAQSIPDLIHEEIGRIVTILVIENRNERSPRILQINDMTSSVIYVNNQVTTPLIVLSGRNKNHTERQKSSQLNNLILVLNLVLVQVLILALKSLER